MPPHAIAVVTPVRAEGGTGPGGWGRALLVIATDAEIAVAIRERLDRAYVTIHEVDAGGAAEALRACRPWPWLVVGAVPEPGAAVLAALRHRPILVFWLGPPPPGLPGHSRAFTRFAELATAIGAALSAEVAGIRLAIGSGVVLPGGDVRHNSELEALVSNHPHPLALPRARFRSAQTVLARRGLGWTLGSSPAGVALQPKGTLG